MDSGAPAPPPPPPSIPPAADPPTGLLAYGELDGFAADKQWRMTHAKWRSLRDLSLSYVLFSFVLGINCVWMSWVVHWVRLSGTRGSWFHLSDNVLIALATTSVANFIGLVAIVAKHLFPEVTNKE